MKRRSAVWTAAACSGAWIGACLMPSAAQAHSASNAYLTVSVDPANRLFRAQWDIALRDLEFVLGINAKGDGKLTWGELTSRQTDIAKYAYSHIAMSAAGAACLLEPGAMQVDDHADGAYAVLNFQWRCAAANVKQIALNYSLFFDVDPTHRGILVFHNAGSVATALLAPESAHVELSLAH